MNRNRLIVLILSWLVCVTMAVAQEGVFVSSIAPDTHNMSHEQANDAALHYWEGCRLDNLLLPDNEAVAEQHFLDFIAIMQQATVHEEAFDTLVACIAGQPSALPHFIMLGKKHLAEPTSVTYNENFYIMMLEAMLRDPSIASSHRLRCEYELSTALKNRIGSVAADFEMLLRNGHYIHLKDISGNYILLLFGDPDCNVCNEAKSEILASTAITQAANNDGLTIVSVCVEGKNPAWESKPAPEGWIDACDEMMTIYDNELYDISDIPSCYLLDSHHRVVLRDVPVSVIEQFFMQQ